MNGVPNGTSSSPAPTSSDSVPASSPTPLPPAQVYAPLIVCGPSGVGKGTLLTRLLKEYPSCFGKTISHTTRPPRAGETHGVSYHFTSVDELLGAVAGGKFVEHALIHGNYYGTSVAAVSAVMNSGRLCLLEIDIQGVLAVRQLEAFRPKCIFIRAPTFGDLSDRLQARGTESDETTRKRLDTARAEMDFFYTHRSVFDADLINDDVEQCYSQLVAAIKRLYPELPMEEKKREA